MKINSRTWTAFAISPLLGAILFYGVFFSLTGTPGAIAAASIVIFPISLLATLIGIPTYLYIIKKYGWSLKSCLKAGFTSAFLLSAIAGIASLFKEVVLTHVIISMFSSLIAIIIPALFSGVIFWYLADFELTNSNNTLNQIGAKNAPPG